MRSKRNDTLARRAGNRSGEARRAVSRPSAEETLARVRADRAQLEQGRLLHAVLVEEVERLHEDLSLLHNEIREIYRQLGSLRKRFPSLPPAPRPAGYPLAGVVAPPAAGGPRPTVPQATA